MMSDFGKRRGESIILFAEKEFKPEVRGRGRGGGLPIHSYVFQFIRMSSPPKKVGTPIHSYVFQFIRKSSPQKKG